MKYNRFEIRISGVHPLLVKGHRAAAAMKVTPFVTSYLCFAIYQLVHFFPTTGIVTPPKSAPFWYCQLLVTVFNCVKKFTPDLP
mmetsp:Transcript_24427/g.37008  ORF Transcript_24427/g.37008 Transcript_24427/m.37008 type:complete len:84 (+) Transcript_24427:20-271(+)